MKILTALILSAIATLSIAPSVHTYDGPQNAGIYIGCHGFEYRGDVGPFHNCG